MLSSPQCEQMLAAIMEASEDAIVGIALDGSIELWSRGAERLYGYSSAEMTGRRLCRCFRFTKSQFKGNSGGRKVGENDRVRERRAAAQTWLQAQRSGKAERYQEWRGEC